MFNKLKLNLRERFLVVPFVNFIFTIALLFFIYGIINNYNKDVQILQNKHFSEIKENGKTMALIIETHNHLYTLIQNAKQLDEAKVYENGAHIFNHIRNIQDRIEKHSLRTMNSELENYLIAVQEIVEMSSVDLNLATTYYDEANTLFVNLTNTFQEFQDKKWEESDSYLNYLSDEVNSGIDYFLLLTILLMIVVTLSAFYLARVLSKEFETLIGIMKKLTKGNYKEVTKIPYLTRDDEIGQIANSVHRFRDSLDLISRYVILSRTDLKGKIIEASDAFCKLSKYPREELIGKSHNVIKHPDTARSEFKAMWKTIKSGNVWSGKIKNRTKDGGYYWVDMNIIPEYDKDGKIVSYLAIRQDITSKINFEQQHKQLVKSEKLASMGEMIGNIAHQWRQPLSVISTGATGLKLLKEHNSLKDEQFFETCDAINENAQYLSNTIDDFKNFIKGDRKKIEFSLKDTVNSFLNLVHGAITNTRVTIILDFDETIKVHGYENELMQCFINIFNNSKEAMEEKKIENRYIFISALENNKEITLTVKDNAGGIPQKIIDKVFEPYFTTKHQAQGTGLGLHMTHNLIVNGMGGTVEVENETYSYQQSEYTGAKFIISLPQS